MTDSAYKTRALVGLPPVTPASGGLAPQTRCRWHPLRSLFESQDHVAATSRRVVASWSLSGADAWAQPGGSSDPGLTDEVPAQVYPNAATWRELGDYRVHLTPGCELEVHVLFCPSGLVQKQVPADPITGNTWASDGAWAELRCGVTWTSGASSTGPHYWSTTLPGSSSGTYGGAENTGDGDNWHDLDEREILQIRPPNFDDTPATQATYSEWPDAEIVLQVRGGFRGVHVIVYEVPLSHTTVHDDDGLTSVHAMPPGVSPLTPRPMMKAPDGATYEEHRFGTRRMMQVAERQSERLGPRVLSWSSWNESTISTLTDTENDPVVVASTTNFVDLLDSTITSYSVDNPGFVVAGAHAQLQRLCGPYVSDGRFAVIPVRVRVEASCTGTGTVRVQCGRSYIDVTGIGNTRQWYTAVGYLQSQQYPDDPSPPLVLFGSPNSATRSLSVWNVSIDFGTWA